MQIRNILRLITLRFSIISTYLQVHLTGTYMRRITYILTRAHLMERVITQYFRCLSRNMMISIMFLLSTGNSRLAP